MAGAQLYKTASGRLFHAGAVAIITVGCVPFIAAESKLEAVSNLLRQSSCQRQNACFKIAV